jgi:hypothetical protein
MRVNTIGPRKACNHDRFEADSFAHNFALSDLLPTVAHGAGAHLRSSLSSPSDNLGCIWVRENYATATQPFKQNRRSIKNDDLFRERRRWLIAGLLFFISTVAFLDRQALSVLERRWRNSWFSPPSIPTSSPGS